MEIITSIQDGFEASVEMMPFINERTFQMNQISDNFKTLITSDRKVFDLNIKELVQYKDLIFLLVKRDFVSKYKQTILGPLWAIIQPLLTSIVFTVIFSNLAHLTTSDSSADLYVPSFLFYLSGTILWNYFSSVVNQTSNTFIANSNVMGKVYFPRLCVPISTALSNLISLGIQLLLFAIVYFICFVNGSLRPELSPMILMIPVSILQLMILSTSVGVIISSLTTKYRDLAMLVGFGLQLWQYATPIAYGLMLIPKKWLSLYLLNPVTSEILTFRYGVFGAGFFSLKYFLISWIFTIVLAFLSVFLFNRIEKTFMDTI